MVDGGPFARKTDCASAAAPEQERTTDQVRAVETSDSKRDDGVERGGRANID